MSEVERYAILFNGSLDQKDLVAAYDRGFAKAFIPLLKEQKFDGIYRLDTECDRQDARSQANCSEPTLEALQAVLDGLKARTAAGKEISVLFMVQGHGGPDFSIPGSKGPIGGKHLAQALNTLPAEFSRTMIFHQCFGGGMLQFGLVDDNDLLWAYSGSDEVNVTGNSITAPFQAKDINRDEVVSFREMHWWSQNGIYSDFAPFYRRFAFFNGPRYPDRGLGTKTALPPFPAELTEIPSVEKYLEESGKAATQGLTVIGFESLRRDRSSPLKQQLAKAAHKQGGWVRFLWLPREVARSAAIIPGEYGSLENESFFKVFYIGSPESETYSADKDVNQILDDINQGVKRKESP